MHLALCYDERIKTGARLRRVCSYYLNIAVYDRALKSWIIRDASLPFSYTTEYLLPVQLEEITVGDLISKFPRLAS